MNKTAKITILLGITFAAATMAATSVNANGKNWTTAKAEQVRVNRQSNAGIGDGGERNLDGTWQGTLFGEDGPMDRDPGGSEGNNQSCPDSDPSKLLFVETTC